MLPQRVIFFLQVGFGRKIRAQTRNSRFRKAPKKGAFEEAENNKYAHFGGFRANVRVSAPCRLF
jgi:hypothetical protein